MYRVNVSSVQDFYQCRFRWWCRWVMNRVPVATASALDEGRLLHRAFERHFAGEPLQAALESECYLFRTAIPMEHPAAQAYALKAVEQIEALIEAAPLWRDKFPVEQTLEVEEPFEWPDPVMGDVLWLGRPDRVVVAGRRIWHAQNRGLAQGMNFGTYTRLQKRSYHEHLYAEALVEKYIRSASSKRLRYGGTVFNLVRKLKFRTNAGRKNEKVKTAAEMFFQHPMAVSLADAHHRAVMEAMRQHVEDMREVERRWREDGRIPAPNEKMNGGYGGNSEDPYFRVLTGEVRLNDDDVFKDREDLYAQAAD